MAVEKYEKDYPWLFSVLQIMNSKKKPLLIGIPFEYWKVDVNKNVGISALEFEKYILNLCLFNVIILIIFIYLFLYQTT